MREIEKGHKSTMNKTDTPTNTIIHTKGNSTNSNKQRMNKSFL